MGSVRTPTGLEKHGKALWKSIAGTYDLRADELRILEDACRQADLIERVRAELDTQPLTVKGSMQQDTPNGHIAELRQMRAGLGRMLASLKLPDQGDESKDKTSASALKAAEARWGRRGTG